MSELPGIMEAKASYREGSVVVQYDPTAVTPSEIAGAIAVETYYTVGEPIVGGELVGGDGAVDGSIAVIRVEGMTDERTASLVTQAIGAAGPAILLPGAEPAIRAVSPDTAQSRLTVTYDAEQVSPQELVDAVQRETGFQASLISTTSVNGAGGMDYTPYVVIGIAALFAAALAWPGVTWARRRLVRAAPSRAGRRRAGRRRR